MIKYFRKNVIANNNPSLSIPCPNPEQIQLVANRLKDAGSMSSDKDEIEPPPPHY